MRQIKYFSYPFCVQLTYLHMVEMFLDWQCPSAFFLLPLGPLAFWFFLLQPHCWGYHVTQQIFPAGRNVPAHCTSWAELKWAFAMQACSLNSVSKMLASYPTSANLLCFLCLPALGWHRQKLKGMCGMWMACYHSFKSSIPWPPPSCKLLRVHCGCKAGFGF